MRKLIAAGQALLLVTGEVTALVALHRLGAEPFLQVPWSDFGGWLRAVDPADALAAALRLAAVGTAWWLTATTVLAVAVRAAGGSKSVLDRLTLPFIRRMADRLGGVAVTAALLASPSGAALAAVQPPSVAAQVTESGWDLPGPPPMPAWPEPPSAPPPEVTPPTQPAPETGTVVLVKGDNLWLVAARQLATATSRPVGALSDRDVHGYWLALIEANRGNLRSGDPDLVYPGEMITLPDPTHAR